VPLAAVLAETVEPDLLEAAGPDVGEAGRQVDAVLAEHKAFVEENP
jgi:hypothetical protein